MDMDEEEFELTKKIVGQGNERPASFWEGSSKDQKERGVVLDFLESVGWEIPYMSNGPNPPDCIGRNEKGEVIGFEVTELVDQGALEMNIKIAKKNIKKSEKDKTSEVYRDWKREEVVKSLEEILAKKDLKIFKGGPYKKCVLIVHNDEVGLIEEEVRNALRDYQFSPTKQINEAYLLLSYRPNCNPPYPVIPLKIKER